MMTPLRKAQRWSWKRPWVQRARLALPGFLRDVAAVALGAFMGLTLNRALDGFAIIIHRLLEAHP